MHQSGQLNDSVETIKASSRAILALTISTTIIYLGVSISLIILKQPSVHILEPNVYNGIFCVQMIITLAGLIAAAILLI